MKARYLQLSMREADRDWMLSATCRGHDPEIFFPENAGMKILRRQIKRALDICDECPVRARCLAHGRAIKATEGIWGGRVFGKNRRPFTSANA